MKRTIDAMFNMMGPLRVLLAASLLALIPLGIWGLPSGINWPGIPWPSWESETVEETSVPLLITMRNISDYHAATGTYQTLVERTVDEPGPAWLSGERIAVYAVGNVDAVVDFSKLTEDDIEVSDDRRAVSIHLPAATLTNAALDPMETRVVGMDRGLFNRINDAASDVPPDYRDLYTSAQGRLNQAAYASELRVRGEQNTVHMLTGMIQSLGFEKVEITFEPAEEPKG
jgi:hypothetical protein